MFAWIKWTACSLVKVAKLFVGLLVGAVLICSFAQLFAVGGAAGLVVAASCWTVEHGVPAVVAAVSKVLESAGTLGAAIGILLGLLLLGVAKLAADAAGAVMEPILAGYRAARAAPPPAVA